MKFVIILVSILILGMFVAGPDGTLRAGDQAGAEPLKAESFFFFPEDKLLLSHNGNAFLSAFPEGVALLTEPRIRTGLIVVFKLRDASGEVVGFASELEDFPAEGLVFGEEELLVWETVWTVTIPGRGSLFLHQQEQESRQVTEQVIAPVMESGGSWEGDIRFRTSVGPGPGGYGVIVGGSGAFSGANGCFVEIDRITKFSADRQAYLSGELQILPEC